VGREGFVTDLVEILRCLPHLIHEYDEEEICENASCKLYKKATNVSSKWAVPVVLSDDCGNVQSSYNEKFNQQYLKCTACKKNTKKRRAKPNSEPEFIIMLLDFIQRQDGTLSPSKDFQVQRIITSNLSLRNYQLEGIINYPKMGHFNCILNSPTLADGAKLKGLWLHDGLYNDVQIVMYSDLQNIWQLNPYVLFYKYITV
jgi:hypothetical protein